MPKKIKLESHLSTAELESRYRESKDPIERSHYQIVWLISQGKTTAEVMEVTGYSRNWIQQLSRRYNEKGPEALGDQRHENPGGAHRALLDEGQRAQLAELLKVPPEDGGMWNSRVRWPNGSRVEREEGPPRRGVGSTSGGWATRPRCRVLLTRRPTQQSKRLSKKAPKEA